MYSALIVEDEDLMREYLTDRLAIICPGWKAAAAASDGIEAVELLAHHHFDAVLTDIRMPGMNGLELARYIRQTDPEMPILILSGYNEFEYARTSMRLNVFDYLLKPLNEDELSAALTAIAVKVEAQNSKASVQLLSAALSGSQDAAKALADKASGRAYCLMVLAPSLLMKSCDRNLALDRLQVTVQNNISPLCTRLSRVLAVLTMSGDLLLAETDCRKTIHRFLENHADISTHVGYAPFDYNQPTAALTAAQKELELALALNEPALPHPLLYAHQQAERGLAFMKDELRKALSAGMLADDAYASLQGRLREFDPKVRMTVLMSLLHECEADDALRSTILDQVSTGGLQDHTKAFSFALERLFSKSKSAGKQVSVLVRQALGYLQLHFSEPVSLSFLAEQLCLSPAYLSTLFHNEMGLSYSQYLLKLRMEDASRRLLADPDVKIHEVGEAVGFPSSKHFSHVFGQYFNIAPKEYRESKRR